MWNVLFYSSILVVEIFVHQISIPCSSNFCHITCWLHFFLSLYCRLTPSSWETCALLRSTTKRAWRQHERLLRRNKHPFSYIVFCFHHHRNKAMLCLLGKKVCICVFFIPVWSSDAYVWMWLSSVCIWLLLHQAKYHDLSIWFWYLVC